MALDYHAVKDMEFPVLTQTYTERDVMLYALGLGFGADPLDPGQLRFVYEEGLRVVPTMPNVFCHPGLWVKRPQLGLDWMKIVHADQRITLHAPLSARATIVAHTRNTGVVDKGEGRGAIITQERRFFDQASGVHVATLESSYMARGDGGFSVGSGISDEPRPNPPPLPEGPADIVHDIATLPQAALIYRLSGDRNPLHADPDAAKVAGFPKPILMGLCTNGVAGHAILKWCCNYDPARFKAMFARFSAPVYPGETIRTEIWRGQNGVSFRAKVVERDVVVLNNGWAELA